MEANRKTIWLGFLCAWLLTMGAPVLADSEVNDTDTSIDAADTADETKTAEKFSDKPLEIDLVALADESKWGLTLYTAWLSAEQLGDMLVFQAELEDDQVWVAALSRRLVSFNRYIDGEVELQVGKHAGPTQRHWEINGLGILRWKRFPWSNHFGTTAAAGIGLSYATEEPQFEIEAHETTNKWLVYILVELSLYLPQHPQWAVVARIHHRSAAYGTFEEDLEGASNAAGVGIKYRF
jgi:hypothetical protein